MASWRDAYSREVEGLFGNLRDRRFEKKPITAGASTPPQAGPPATLVPFAFNGSGVFDENEWMEVLIYIPDEMVKIVKARVVLSFREFFAPATTVSSGGGSTSGTTSTPSGGGSTSGASSASTSSTSAIGLNMTACPHHAGHAHISSLDDHSHGIGHTHTTPDHTHPSHSHTTPAHTHDLAYGMFKETLPGSWDIELRVHQWDGSAWQFVDSIATGLTSQMEDVDLTDMITEPGKWRITLMSAVGEPNDGRLGCDVAGHIIGAIQALQS